jgi:hypothetical protein
MTRPAHSKLVASWVISTSVALAAQAHATAGTAFSETSRSAALADAVSARPGDAGTILLNPAELADIDEPMVLLGGHADHLSAWFARTGEPRTDLGRSFGGFSIAAATPLPGPSWLRRFRFGIALDLPAQYALKVSVSDRLDQPTSPIYDGPPDRMSASAALAARVFDWLRLGAGVGIVPSLSLPTSVTYVAGRDPSVDRSVEVRLDSSLQIGFSPFVGLRAQPADGVGVALVYRAASFSRATGSQRTVAGGILADDPIDFYEGWAPAELVLGGALGPHRGWSISTDLTLHRWSRYESAFDTALVPPLHDTLSIRSGIEWAAARAVAVRAGVALEPSPIPNQYGVTNYLGADTLVLALGGGVDLRKLTGAPLLVDAHVRSRLGATQSALKRPNALPDASSDLPGQQIDNLGYPGFRSHADEMQVGLTVTIFVGKDKKR